MEIDFQVKPEFSFTIKEFHINQEDAECKFIEETMENFKKAICNFQTEYSSNIEYFSKTGIEAFKSKYDNVYNSFQIFKTLKEKAKHHKNIQLKVCASFERFNRLREYLAAWFLFHRVQKKRRINIHQSLKNRRKTKLHSCFLKWRESYLNEKREVITCEVVKESKYVLESLSNKYESEIKRLENILESKLKELKIEEEEERLLQERYNEVLARRNMNASASQTINFNQF